MNIRWIKYLFMQKIKDKKYILGSLSYFGVIFGCFLSISSKKFFAKMDNTTFSLKANSIPIFSNTIHYYYYYL